jgi:hypothetical protein
MPFSMFLAVSIMIVIIPASNMYFLYAGHSDKQRAIWNSAVSGYAVFVFIITALFIGSLKKILQLIIIFEKIHVVSIISIAAYQAFFSF